MALVESSDLQSHKRTRLNHKRAPSSPETPQRPSKKLTMEERSVRCEIPWDIAM